MAIGQGHALAHARGVGGVPLGGRAHQHGVIGNLQVGGGSVARALLEVLPERREPRQRIARAFEVAHIDPAQKLDLHGSEPPDVVLALEGDGLEAAQGAGAIELKVVAVCELDGDGVRGAAEAVAGGKHIEHRTIAGRVAILGDDLSELEEQCAHAHARDEHDGEQEDKADEVEREVALLDKPDHRNEVGENQRDGLRLDRAHPLDIRGNGLQRIQTPVGRAPIPRRRHVVDAVGLRRRGGRGRKVAHGGHLLAMGLGDCTPSGAAVHRTGVPGRKTNAAATFNCGRAAHFTASNDRTPDTRAAGPC